MSLNQKALLKAITEAKEKSKKRKFTQSIELILSLRNLDIKSAQGRIDETVELPHVPDEQNKIFFAASGELALKAKKAKVDFIIDRIELERIAGKKKELRKLANNYDYFIAEVSLMPLVARVLGPALGPRGKRPVPVPPTADVKEIIAKHRKAITIRARNQPIVQCRIGTESMKAEAVVENIQTVIRTVERKLKNGIKDIKEAYVKTSMGSPVKIVS